MSSETMQANKKIQTDHGYTEGCRVYGHSWVEYGTKALIWSLGKIVQHGDSGSKVMGLMSLQVPCGQVLLAGT